MINTASDALIDLYEDVLQVLMDSKTARDGKKAVATAGSRDETEDASPPTNLYSTLMVQLYGWLHQLPVLGVNSGKYDLNTIKHFLISQLLLGEEEEEEEKDKKEDNIA